MKLCFTGFILICVEENETNYEIVWQKITKKSRNQVMFFVVSEETFGGWFTCVA